MIIRRGLWALLLTAARAYGAADPGNTAPAGGAVDFLRDVRPILASHCFKCHGPDEEARKAKLRLDLRENALQPAKSGELPIVPGKPDRSELVRRVFSADENEAMPPPAANKDLTPDQKEILKRWVAAGAEYKPHWAFVKPSQAPPPATRDAAWPRNAIDQFVLARLEREGLKPSPRADDYTLARRLYLDLIGLPPTPEQADAFANDHAPGAYERLVDRLLASPHYGERWARRWLDLARYADTNGFEKDRPRSMWPWRDWVIEALNRDMPFDEFTIEQMAGDMLPQATQDQRVATGFHRNTMRNEEGGIDPLEYRFYSTVDRVNVTATAWLGLTMACAQCHTHKYDPIQHSEYYRFLACLNNADEPKVEVIDAATEAKRKPAQAEIDALEAALPDQFPLPLGIDWLTPGAAEFASAHGAEAELLSDGSFRVGGKNPEKEVYTLTFSAPLRRITHLELEAIPDEKVGKGGPGRTEHGNFVLSELEMEVQETGGDAKARRVKFASAEADFSQEGYPVQNAIDGKTDTGWGIGGGGGGRQHHYAIFALAEPVELKTAANITVRLIQDYGSQHTLGRFRVSLGTEPPGRIATAERRRALRDEKFAKWLRDTLPTASDWKRLHPAEAFSNSPTLAIQEDDSVFASGDFTKNDIYTVAFRHLPEGVKALRLEVLPDDRLPMHGPGTISYEGPEGDFWLSNLKVTADGKTVGLTNASQDFARDNNDAAKAIDEDRQSGWSINGGQGKPHYAVFQFAEGVAKAEELRVELTFEKYYAAALGRFRVWVTTEDRASASPLSNEALAALVQCRHPERLQAILAANLGIDARPGSSPPAPSEAAREKPVAPSESGGGKGEIPGKGGLAASGAAAEREILLREFAQWSPALAGARSEIEKRRAELPAFSTTLVMRERPPGQTRRTFRQHRGDFLQPKEEVAPGAPAFLPPLPADAPPNRLTLARWLVSPENPLTARVVMNRQWEAFFGAGIVRTLQDFGFQGELPSHPELLDWLAVEFMRQGWSLKKMHKLIVMSATYQQASAVSPALRERDPLNALLARGPRFRLEAELVRDTALTASGLLSEKIGGPSVYPPQPPGVSTEGAYGPLEWKTSEGPDRYRRGLYTFAKRTAPFAMTATFDGPSGEACLARRDRSDTPLQALTLLNDTAFLECSRALGELAVKASGDDAQRAELIFRRCLTRPPTPEERDKLVAFYLKQRDRFAHGELKAGELLNTKDGERLNEQAAWTTVARALLNLDETITKS